MDSTNRRHSPSPASSTDSYLKLCETPQNSPAESRPLSPTLMKEVDEKEKAGPSKTLKSKQVFISSYVNASINRN